MAVKTIDLEKCIGCGTCVETCPMDVFRLDSNPQSMGYDSPCREVCPLGVNQKEYHNLLKLDMIEEATRSLASYHPMPVITGYICPHTCENECARNHVDQAVNINAIEQYLGEAYMEQDVVPYIQENGRKVAVIGAGPAGLSAAYFLRLAGYQVTVFDKEKKPGGMLYTVIPEFRLPESVLDKQIAYYEKMGISFSTGTMVGMDIGLEELNEQGFHAYIAAVGAGKPSRLSVPGADAEGITTAMEYLCRIKSKKITNSHGKVAVIGGGSVALDAARSAVRLGAQEVHLFCLEVLESNSKDSMLAPYQEIQDAIEEGVVIHPSRSVDHFVVEDGKVVGIQCVMCLSVRDEDGRFNPQYGDTVLPEVLSVNEVVLAIGQGADRESVPQGFNINQRGYVMADKETNQVLDNLFAAGDGVTGPTTVVRALASGKRTAEMVIEFLNGKELSVKNNVVHKDVNSECYEKLYTVSRNERKSLSACEGRKSFQVRMEPMDWYHAYMESKRCLTCGSKSTISYVADCQVCRLCVDYCPTGAIEVVPGQIPNNLHAWDIHNLKS